MKKLLSAKVFARAIKRTSRGRIKLREVAA